MLGSLLALLPPLLVLAGLLAFAVWVDQDDWPRRFGPPRPRALWAALTVAGLVGAGWILCSPENESGTWFCRVCGACEEGSLRFGVIVKRPIHPEDPDELAARPYREWFRKELALTHVHDWVPTGCHDSALRISCSLPRWGRRTFHAALPRVPDPEIARALATRLAHAFPWHRTAMLDDFNRDESPSDPFGRIVRGESLSLLDFRAAYEAWKERHPLWN